MMLAGWLTLAGAVALADEHEKTQVVPGFAEFDLVSDVTNAADQLDARLVNPWGVVAGRDAVWVNANGTGLLLAYDAAGAAVGTAVYIPGPAGGTTVGAPTGLVLNRSAKFVVTSGAQSAPATFLIATEDGTIAAWNKDVTGDSAVIVVDNSAAGAVYKGLAVAAGPLTGPQIYAADFHGGKIDVFGPDFHLVKSFTDATVPAGYAPFNVQLIRGRLFVTFAKQLAPDLKDDESGPGNGFVDIFDGDGTLVRRLVSGGALNSPWGLAVWPGRFGERGPALLVGNFGDGKINAYDLASGTPLGQLKRSNGDDLVIDRLWGFAPAQGDLAEDTETGGTGERHGFGHEDRDATPLFFAAGIHDEAHGLFGFVRPVEPVTVHGH